MVDVKESEINPGDTFMKYGMTLRPDVTVTVISVAGRKVTTLASREGQGRPFMVSMGLNRFQNWLSDDNVVRVK